mmetsp:Transcript_14775/g.22903  ORF Transcript_14775/g.22903 Transcript_14775/m.22903 type:complete len:181 (-) Transcript_14775:52-594(-)
MAPELVKKREYDGRQVDMWALGVLLFSLLAGSFPFRGANETELYSKIMRGNFHFPDFLHREARYIVSRLVEVDTRRRFKASDLLREPWIKCGDLPLSIFESAGGLFRANSVDNRTPFSITGSAKQVQADLFNKNLTKLHLDAVEHLKGLGYSKQAIEESMKGKGKQVGVVRTSNEVYQLY